ncbi:MAG: protease modulator HflC [Deltaproteobacteria bacterium]|nr:protease modulator HflC [Deltaproteobacteria bacterium]
MKLKGIIIAAIVVVGLFLFTAAYVVDETEQVVVTQFGKVVGQPKTEPGLYFKLPVIQQATYFPKNLQHWDGDPGQIPTLDKTYIWVDAFARWKIIDPVKFFQTVNNVVGAQARLDNIIDPAVRNLITENRLIEAVRRTNRRLDTFEVGLEEMKREEAPVSVFMITTGREKITEAIVAQAQPKLNQFGIELVDVKLKRINYVEEVRESVYARMIAERKQIAEKFRSEGQGEARKILWQKERDLKEITSEAYRIAQEIKGKADAEATRLYAEAYGVDPDFYSFTKTLETYSEAMDKNTSVVLSTDTEFFKYLKDYRAD